MIGNSPQTIMAVLTTGGVSDTFVYRTPTTLVDVSHPRVKTAVEEMFRLFDRLGLIPPRNVYGMMCKNMFYKRIHIR